MKENDMVDHPPHYNKHPSGIECIQITEHMCFNLGNAVKYIYGVVMIKAMPLRICAKRVGTLTVKYKELRRAKPMVKYRKVPTKVEVWQAIMAAHLHTELVVFSSYRRRSLCRP